MSRSVLVEGAVHVYDTAANQPTAANTAPGTHYHQTDTGLEQMTDGVKWYDVSSEGAAHVTRYDALGNEVTPAFSPGTPYPLTATASSQSVALGSATSVRIASASATAAFIRIKFGTTGGSASATNDLPVNVGGNPQYFYVPSGATELFYIRDTTAAADVSFDLNLG